MMCVVTKWYQSCKDAKNKRKMSLRKEFQPQVYKIYTITQCNIQEEPHCFTKQFCTVSIFKFIDLK